ncbi:MAG: flagellar basal body-associated FliL family protein [Micromonosporaceae bacterium]|nr:flagellar basal body-associated FliL family protein [Micromonosporaceae bacterium]
MSGKGKSGGGLGAKMAANKKLLVIALIVLAFVGGGGGSYYFFVYQPSQPEPEPEPGAVVVLESITINLADGHFLKLGFALQQTLEVEEALDGSKALDIAIDLFSNRSIAELSSNDERNRMKQELKEKVKKAYHDEIIDVYFTEFVMQ